MVVPQSKVGQALGFVLSKKVKCSYFKGQGNNTNLGAKEFGVLNKMQLHRQNEGLVHETRAPPISSHGSMKKYVIITDFKSVRVDYIRAQVSLAFNM